jgi:hypothetical protein
MNDELNPTKTFDRRRLKAYRPGLTGQVHISSDIERAIYDISSSRSLTVAGA